MALICNTLVFYNPTKWEKSFSTHNLSVLIKIFIYNMRAVTCLLLHLAVQFTSTCSCKKEENLILLSTLLTVLKLHKSNLASSGSSKMLSGNQSIKSNKIVFKVNDFLSLIPGTARQMQKRYPNFRFYWAQSFKILLAPASHTQVDVVRAKLYSGTTFPASPEFHLQPDCFLCLSLYATCLQLSYTL